MCVSSMVHMVHLTARFEWYYLLNCHHYTCFIANLLQSLVGVCVLYGGSFDEEAQLGLSKAKFKSTCIGSYACFIADILQSSVFVCVCVLYCGSFDKEVQQGLKCYLSDCHQCTCFIAVLLQSLVCACALYGGSLNEDSQPGLSKAIF